MCGENQRTRSVSIERHSPHKINERDAGRDNYKVSVREAGRGGRHGAPASSRPSRGRPRPSGQRPGTERQSPAWPTVGDRAGRPGSQKQAVAPSLGTCNLGPAPESLSPWSHGDTGVCVPEPDAGTSPGAGPSLLATPGGRWPRL